MSWTVNETISCDLTYGCHWERSHKKRKRLMKTLSCVYSSDLWPAPKADIIPQCALIGRQQPLEGRSGFSPGLVTKSHESIQCWLEGSEMVPHEKAQYTFHCRVMTSSKFLKNGCVRTVIRFTWSNTSWCLEITGPWNRDFITLRSKIWSPIATPIRCLG